VDINILDFNYCWGVILLVLNGALYSGFFSETKTSKLFIDYHNIPNYNTDPLNVTITVINKTIRITANTQYVHWLGIISGQVTDTIQSIA
jgi:hypothetical protein